MKKWEQPEVYVLGVESTKGGDIKPPPDPGTDPNFNPHWVTKKLGAGDDKYINDQADKNKWEYYFYSS